VKSDYVICLDLGGTNLDAGLVSIADKKVIKKLSVPSPSHESLEDTLDLLTKLITDLHDEAKTSGFQVNEAVIDIPNYFDYEVGVSWMEHKFEALYGHNIKQPLEERTGLSLKFLNDADAFGLGAYWLQAPTAKRLIGITIGTGLGGAFIEDGQLADGPEVPPDGEIWDHPMNGGIFEVWVSGDAISQIYVGLGGQHSTSAKDIEDLARSGEEIAIKAWQQLGQNLGKGLATAAPKFIPEQVIVGGKVSRAFDLFGPAAEQSYADKIGQQVPFGHAQSEDLALLGAAYYASQK
jgi:glucokinase